MPLIACAHPAACPRPYRSAARPRSALAEHRERVARLRPRGGCEQRTRAPWPLLLVFLCVWGAAVIADSGVFSTALSETADQRLVGTALTVQTAVGFALTVVTIQLVPLLAEIAGWQYAFVLLAPGPVLGALAMQRFGAAIRRQGAT